MSAGGGVSAGAGAGAGLARLKLRANSTRRFDPQLPARGEQGCGLQTRCGGASKGVRTS